MKLPNGSFESFTVDDSLTVGPSTEEQWTEHETQTYILTLVCDKIGLVNYREYSFEILPFKKRDKVGKLGKGKLLNDIEKLKQTMNTEDGGEN